MTTLPEPGESPRPVVQDDRPGWRRHGIFFPLLLVAAGVIFLLSNLGYINTSGWGFIIQLWPLLLIVGGLDSLWKGEGIAGPIFWLGLGVLFLLGNFGYLGISAIEMILRYWPLLLIAIGIDILIGRRTGLVGQILAVLVALALLAGIFWFTTSSRLVIGSAIENEAISQPLQNATLAETSISMAAGELIITAGAADDQLVEGSIRVSDTHQVNQDASIENGKAIYRLEEHGVAISWGGNTANNEWNLKLNADVPNDLRVNLGAGEAHIDLTGMDITGLSAETAVGQLLITLPAQGEFDGHISGAIGEVIVRVPRGLPVRITTNTVIVGHNVASAFTKQDNVYTHPGEGQTVNLFVNAVIGSVRLEEIAAP